MLINQNNYKKVLIAAPEIQAIPVIDCGETLVAIQESRFTKKFQNVKTSLVAVKHIFIRETIQKKLLKA